jgi:hypothetical protein
MSTTEQYGLGRLPQPDIHNANFRAIDLVSVSAPIRTRFWNMRAALNQGNTPQCTDYSIETALMGAPKMLRAPAAPLGMIYHLAQTLDAWPGENYDGTSVLAAHKAAVKLGLIKEYRWMLTFIEILQLLSNYGPVVIGSNWYEGMFYPNKKGEVTISGSIAGGHAYCLCGIDSVQKRVRKLGSWGSGWGQSGRAWLSFDTLERLFSENGEAALPVQQTIT